MKKAEEKKFWTESICLQIMLQIELLDEVGMFPGEAEKGLILRKTSRNADEKQLEPTKLVEQIRSGRVKTDPPKIKEFEEEVRKKMAEAGGDVDSSKLLEEVKKEKGGLSSYLVYIIYLSAHAQENGGRQIPSAKPHYEARYTRLLLPTIRQGLESLRIHEELFDQDFIEKLYLQWFSLLPKVPEKMAGNQVGKEIGDLRATMSLLKEFEGRVDDDAIMERKVALFRAVSLVGTLNYKSTSEWCDHLELLKACHDILPNNETLAEVYRNLFEALPDTLEEEENGASTVDQYIQLVQCFDAFVDKKEMGKKFASLFRHFVNH
jgi:hypothetical protein